MADRYEIRTYDDSPTLFLAMYSINPAKEKIVSHTPPTDYYRKWTLIVLVKSE